MARLRASRPPARAPPRAPRRSELRIEPGIDFEASHVLYHITVRNRGESTFRDVVITPAVLHGAFAIDEPPKAVPVLEPGTFGTASFRVESRGPPGDVELGGRVEYTDDGGARREAAVAPVRVDLSPPALRPVHLPPEALRERASRSFSVQDAFDLPVPAESAFPVLEAAIAGTGLERVESTTHRDGNVFVGRASFHGLDGRRNSYAVRIVASRRGPASSLKLLVFAQAEERLFGFYWRVRESVRGALGSAPHQP